MDRILVLTPHEDRAGRAVALASALAQRTGARLTLLRALEESLGDADPVELGSTERSLRALLTEAETRRVGALADRIRAQGLEVSVEVCWGASGQLAVDLVHRDGFDLVVKAASGVGHGGRVFFGATALHLFRRCPCPVWMVGDEGRLPAKVLAAIDPSRADGRRDAATRILDWADRIAAWSGGSVRVASAWHAAAAEVLSESLADGDRKAYVDAVRRRADADLRSLLAERAAPLPAEHVHLLEGAASEALPRFAEERAVDLIVMGTLGRAGRFGELLGETAETILRQIRASVLTIPPSTHGQGARSEPERPRAAAHR